MHIYIIIVRLDPFFKALILWLFFFNKLILQYNVFYRLVCFHCEYLRTQKYKRVSGQSPPREIAPRLGLGFGQGLALELGLGAKFLGRRQIVLESTKMLIFQQSDTFEETHFEKSVSWL